MKKMPFLAFTVFRTRYSLFQCSNFFSLIQGVVGRVLLSFNPHPYEISDALYVCHTYPPSEREGQDTGNSINVSPDRVVPRYLVPTCTAPVSGCLPAVPIFLRHDLKLKVLFTPGGIGLAGYKRFSIVIDSISITTPGLLMTEHCALTKKSSCGG